MAELLYSILLICVGALDLVYSIKFFVNHKFAKKYIETSPKAWIWRKLFGIKKAIKITRSIFAPLGIIIGVILIILGIILLTL